MSKLRSQVDPVELLEEREQAAYIRSAIRFLPERHRLVTIAYFLESKTLEEIGELLDVTPSRVSQIKEDSLRRIREGLADQYVDPFEETRTRRRAPARKAYAAQIAAAGTS